MNTEYVYGVYLLIKAILTIWVAQTVYNNGRVLLVAAFRGSESMANAVNHLIRVGFYLINIGFDLLFLRSGAKPQTLVEAVEYTTAKIGVVMLIMGVMQFITLFTIARMCGKTRLDAATPVVKRAVPSGEDFVPALIPHIN